MTAQPTARASTYAGLFLLTLATLLHELLLTRIFSVTMWYHFAFMAVSVAMFGMTVGAVIVYLRPARYSLQRVGGDMAVNALLFGVTAVLSILAHLAIPFEPEPTPRGIAMTTLTYVIIALPFVFSGIAVALALTRFPEQANRLYAADLIGAAVACALFVQLLDWTDGPTAAAVVAAIGGLAAFAFTAGATHRLTRILAVVTLLGFAGWTALGTARSRAQDPLVRLAFVKGQVEPEPLWERWNCFSRVAVFGDPEERTTPFGWGLSDTYVRSQNKKRQLGINIDATAATVMTHFDGDLGEIDHLKSDITNMVHYVRPKAKVLVIGTGGGRDVLSALAFEQSAIVGVEINDNILRALNRDFGDFTGHLDRQPGVAFFNDEARSWLSRTQQHFDIIQISLIDTWAATAAGAFVFTENSLYTLEAWKLFLSRLQPNGVLSLSRWYFPDRPGELYRLAALANAALRAHGVEDPRKHLVALTHIVDAGVPGESDPAGVCTMLVSRSPFSEADLDVIDQDAIRLQFNVMLSPRVSKDPDLERFATTRELVRACADYPLDVSPPTDDRPFFFHMLRLSDALESELWRQGDMSFNLKAVSLLFTLLGVTAVLTLLCIVVPLALSVRRVKLASSLPLFLFFAAIGVGFMLVEISQMQRLVVFLGAPIYGFSVVLFALLVASGLGSFSTQLGSPGGWLRSEKARLIALLVAVAVFGTATPRAIESYAAAELGMRIAVACALLFPLGFFLGMAFPIGLRLAAREQPGLTPWMWGINGATSVCATVAALALSLSLGISATLWIGFLCYVAALFAYLWAARSAGGAAAKAPG